MFGLYAPMDIRAPRILLCDDNPDDQALTRRFLRRACPEAEILTASDGEEAVGKLQAIVEGAEALPALVLLDFRMPKLRGDEVLRSVRWLEGLKDVPFVLFCSDIVPREVEECREAGVNQFVQKPSEYEVYEEAVKSIVAQYMQGGCASRVSVS